MILQTTQIQSSQPYTQTKKFPLPQKSLDLWLQQLQLAIPILQQCAVISRLDERDWQQIGRGINLTEIDAIQQTDR